MRPAHTAYFPMSIRCDLDLDAIAAAAKNAYAIEALEAEFARFVAAHPGNWRPSATWDCMYTSDEFGPWLHFTYVLDVYEDDA